MLQEDDTMTSRGEAGATIGSAYGGPIGGMIG